MPIVLFLKRKMELVSVEFIGGGACVADFSQLLKRFKLLHFCFSPGGGAARRGEYLRVGWELLHPGGNHAVKAGGFRWDGARGSRALQPSTRFWVRSPRTLGNAGGDPVVRGGVEEACLRVYLITGKAIVSYRKSSLIHGLTGQNRNRRIQGSRSHIEIY
jgi:hypothetical protein